MSRLLMSYAWAYVLPAEDKLVLLALCDLAEDDGALPRLGRVDMVRVLDARFGGTVARPAEAFACLEARKLLAVNEARLVWQLDVSRIVRGVRHVE